jgi:hypothetical protein
MLATVCLLASILVASSQTAGELKSRPWQQEHVLPCSKGHVPF